jgi:cystathionine beta-lyase/cystathionine gamma-synthase
MFSLVIKSDSIDGVERFCDSLKHFLLACSWGGYESLAFPVCTLEADPSYKSTTISRNLVRLYIGLEDPMLLKEDLMQALEKV